MVFRDLLYSALPDASASCQWTAVGRYDVKKSCFGEPCAKDGWSDDCSLITNTISLFFSCSRTARCLSCAAIATKIYCSRRQRPVSAML